MLMSRAELKHQTSVFWFNGPLICQPIPSGFDSSVYKVRIALTATGKRAGDSSSIHVTTALFLSQFNLT